MKNKESLIQMIKTKNELRIISKHIDKALNYKKNATSYKLMSMSPVKQINYNSYKIQSNGKEMCSMQGGFQVLYEKRSTTPNPTLYDVSPKVRIERRVWKKPGKIYRTTENTICLFSNSIKAMIPRIRYLK